MSELLGKVTNPATLLGLILILCFYFYLQKGKNKYALWVFAVLAILAMFVVVAVYAPKIGGRISAVTTGKSSQVEVGASGAKDIDAKTSGDNSPIKIENK